MNAQPEHALQCAIVKHLRAMGFLVAAVPNGGKTPGTRVQRAIRGARMKREGLVAGFPDLLVFASQGRVGAIEVKSATGRQTDEQKACAASLEALGHHFALCRSIDDVEAALADWGWV